MNLEEEYLQDVIEAPKGASVTYENLFEKAMKGAQQPANPRGFVVQGAPWERAPNTASQIDFPDFGLGGSYLASSMESKSLIFFLSLTHPLALSMRVNCIKT